MQFSCTYLDLVASLNPFAKGFDAIFSFVICNEELKKNRIINYWQILKKAREIKSLGGRELSGVNQFPCSFYRVVWTNKASDLI